MQFLIEDLHHVSMFTCTGTSCHTVTAIVSTVLHDYSMYEKLQQLV